MVSCDINTTFTEFFICTIVICGNCSEIFKIYQISGRSGIRQKPKPYAEFYTDAGYRKCQITRPSLLFFLTSMKDWSLQDKARKPWRNEKHTLLHGFFILDGCSFHYAYIWSESGISICWRHLVKSKETHPKCFFFGNSLFTSYMSWATMY